MLRLLCFFVELGHHTDTSLEASVREKGVPDEKQVVAYLDSGQMVLPLMEGCPDPITGDIHPRSGGGSSHMTDGNWVWRLDLAYYIETYHVELPQEFLDDVRRNDYQVPPVKAAEFKPLYEQVLPLFGWSPQWDTDKVTL